MASQRLTRGFIWGLVATALMSIPMVIGVITGVAPMPKPIPVAIMGSILGSEVPRPLLMLLGAAAHLTFGGFWGAVLAALVWPATVWKGITLAVALWLGMQLVALPFVGWGVFGVAITLSIAMTTLILHVIYGTALGWLLDREEAASGQRLARPAQ